MFSGWESPQYDYGRLFTNLFWWNTTLPNKSFGGYHIFDHFLNFSPAMLHLVRHTFCDVVWAIISREDCEWCIDGKYGDVEKLKSYEKIE